MPTIDQIAAGQALSGADEFLVSQIVGGNRVTAKTTLGALMTLLASLGIQPDGFLSGQGAPANGAGEDGWTYLNASNGDVYQRASGTWTKMGSLLGPAGAPGAAGPSYSLHTLSGVTTMADTDEVAVVVGGADRTIPLSDMLGSETIDMLTAANAASDTDTFMTGQSSNILVRQTLAALWTWVQGHLPGYKAPVQEFTGSVSIDGTYNGKILVVTGAGVTITPNFGLMGSGFECEIVTSASGSVLWGGGITATDGGTGLSGNAHAKLLAFTSSAGNTVLASIRSASSGASVSPSGSITNLAVTGAATTSSSLTFTWTAPTSGGTATYYLVQYRVNGTSGWTSVGTNPTSPTVTLTGLFASTAYDVQVAASNSGGVPSSFVQLLDTSTASASSPPGVPSGLATGTVSSSSVALSWVAPTTGGAPTGYTVEYSSDSGSSWSSPVSFGNVTNGAITGLSANTAYAFRVAAFNTAGSSGYVPTSSYPTATTSAAYTVTLAFDGNLPPTTPISHSGAWPGGGLNFTVSPSLPTSGTAWLGYSQSNATPPTTGLIQCASDGQTNGYGAYCSPPTTAGTWYVWAIAMDSSAAVVGAQASTAITVT